MATTISVGPGNYIRPYRKCRIVHWGEDSSQTFIKGDPLMLSTDSNDGNLVKLSTEAHVIVGFAAESASGTKNNKVAVWVADENAEFVGHVEDAMALDADFIGDEYDIIADATNLIWRVDTTDTTNPVVKIVELKDAVGDTNGRVVFKVLNAARAVYAS